MKVSFGGGAELVMERVLTGGGRAVYSFSGRSVNRFASATVRGYVNGVVVAGSAVTSANVGAGWVVWCGCLFGVGNERKL